MRAIITKNGRPAGFGSMFIDDGNIKYCVGYCQNCREKIGLTGQALNELAEKLPGRIRFFIWRITNAKIAIPK